MRRLIARFPLTATLAAMIAWALHFVLVYAATGLACARPQALDMAALGGWLLSTTLLALAAVALAGGVGVVCTRHAPGSEGNAERRRRFLGGVALLLAVLAFIAIVFVSLPILLVPPCAGWGSA